MASPQAAFTFVMKHEDPRLTGVVRTDNDGGKVRFGVNSNANPQALVDGFYGMSYGQALGYALELFRGKYWAGIRGDALSDQRLANQLADLAYNAGAGQAIIILQRALNALRAVEQISIDGAMGPQTLAAIASVDAAELLAEVKEYAELYYRSLHRDNPAKYTAADLASWLNRLNA